MRWLAYVSVRRATDIIYQGSSPIKRYPNYSCHYSRIWQSSLRMVFRKLHVHLLSIGVFESSLYKWGNAQGAGSQDLQLRNHHPSKTQGFLYYHALCVFINQWLIKSFISFRSFRISLLSCIFADCASHGRWLIFIRKFGDRYWLIVHPEPLGWTWYLLFG